MIKLIDPQVVVMLSNNYYAIWHFNGLAYLDCLSPCDCFFFLTERVIVFHYVNSTFASSFCYVINVPE
jgi:hypothetical protein